MFASLTRMGAVILASVTALCVAACFTVGLSTGSSSSCMVSTSAGAIAGQWARGVCAFHGIPYAAAPTGPRRFAAPQPAAPWTGVLHARDHHRVCPQFRAEQTEQYPDDRQLFLDEDCLYLNVWTPNPDHAGRPVLVWIHGGAGQFGNANEPRYDGAIMAARGDVVVVNLNYRLGVFGWTELGGLDPAYRGSGNNGLRDQIAALDWVHAHIAAFGGDPDNVTTVGQSEGALSISAMLATEHPQRLFRRVILESGNGYLVHSAQLENNLVDNFWTVSGVTTVAQLRQMSTSDLLALQNKAIHALPGVVSATSYFGPYVDGQLVRGPVISKVAQGNARGVEILIGTNRDELRFFAQINPAVLHLPQSALDAIFPAQLADRRQRMIATYQANRPGSTEGEITLAMLNDQTMRIPATRLAEAQSQWQPGYVYQFNWQPADHHSLGAIHTAEMTFVFGTYQFIGNPGATEAFHDDPTPISTLSNQILDAWTSFARTGNPNTHRTTPRPYWPPYYPDSRQTMIWDTPASTQPALHDDERALWDGFDFASLNLKLSQR